MVDEQSKDVRRIPAKRFEELNQYLHNIPEDYNVRVSDADVELNKLWFNVKDLSLKITKAGVQIENVMIKGCITSW